MLTNQQSKTNPAMWSSPSVDDLKPTNQSTSRRFQRPSEFSFFQRISRIHIQQQMVEEYHLLALHHRVSCCGTVPGSNAIGTPALFLVSARLFLPQFKATAIHVHYLKSEYSSCCPFFSS